MQEPQPVKAEPIKYPPDFDEWWADHIAASAVYPTREEKLMALVGWLARERVYLVPNDARS